MSIPESDAAVTAWMKRQGWKVLPARREEDPDMVFYIWQEDEPSIGRSHALWIDEAMLQDLSAEQLIQVLDRERVAEEIRINFKVRIRWNDAPCPRQN